MSTCTRCGSAFSCGMVDDKSPTPCWCTQLPPLPAPGNGGDGMPSCYCPACLALLTAAAKTTEK